MQLSGCVDDCINTTTASTAGFCRAVACTAGVFAEGTRAAITSSKMPPHTRVCDLFC